ncbi:hypothetical protein KFE25_002331 [Diacronema lutheri]|uniref:Secreted protein n=1 Tax=Diacronema lutheri TaxID=2081491 RepID=A0A8J5XCL3_DIALT|nr:hypothetical protein KFE25_002331 [Diacronema lutheri]
MRARALGALVFVACLASTEALTYDELPAMLSAALETTLDALIANPPNPKWVVIVPDDNRVMQVVASGQQDAGKTEAEMFGLFAAEVLRYCTNGLFAFKMVDGTYNTVHTDAHWSTAASCPPPSPNFPPVSAEGMGLFLGDYSVLELVPTADITALQFDAVAGAMREHTGLAVAP